MSSLSNDQGRAFEYACITKLYQYILPVRKVEIVKDSHYLAAERAWNSIDESMQNLLDKSAVAAIPYLSELEPMIMEKDDDMLSLQIQPDGAGEQGDVRDILIIRKACQWEIGLSMKHNHFAVKHSRLSRTIDFGEKWFNHPCSQTYWDAVMPIFEKLEEMKERHVLWSSVSRKEEDIYIPLLNAFADEINRSYHEDSSIPQKMVAYLLGEYDFYKVIGQDTKQETEIDSFNLYGSLNKPAKNKISKI